MCHRSRYILWKWNNGGLGRQWNFLGPSAFAARVLLTSLRRIVLEADPLAAAFAVLGQELLLFLVVDADQISSPRQAVLISCSPALLLGPVHVVEELEPTGPRTQRWKVHRARFIH